MSRAQGDNYKTWTNKGLKEYRARLDKKLDKLAEKKTKVYHFGDFIIFCTTFHILVNDRGNWKWDGWRIFGDEYFVTMYEKEGVTYTGQKMFTHAGYKIDELPVLHRHFTTEDSPTAKDEANAFFKECKAYALA